MATGASDHQQCLRKLQGEDQERLEGPATSQEVQSEKKRFASFTARLILQLSENDCSLRLYASQRIGIRTAFS